jgi:hypothetical protein
MTALEPTQFRVEVAQTSRNRQYWATRSWVAPVRQDEIRAADILVVPWEDFREDHKALFPQGTTSYLQKLKESFPNSRIAIAIERDQYQEIAVHAREWRLPALMVSIVLLPALADVLATQANRWISSPQDDDRVRMEVIVEGDKGRCISIKYEGPPDRLAQTLIEQAQRCFPDASSEAASEMKR